MNKLNWTKEELLYLKNNYQNINTKIISKYLNRSSKAIFNMASRLNIAKLNKETTSLSFETAKNNLHDFNPNITLITYTKYHDVAKIMFNACSHDTELIYSHIINRDIRCQKCNIPNLRSLSDINKILENTLPNITFTSYNGSLKHANTKCNTCGYEWLSTPGDVLREKCGHICRMCNPNNGISKEEKDLVDFIKINYSGWILENERKTLEGKELDIVLPDLGLAIEYNGVYWHSDKFKDKHYHIDKTNQLKEEMDYRLIHINSDEWLTKRNIVESRVLNLLGKSSKIPARKCNIKEIGFPKEFLTTNHIQGSGSPTSINLGLFLNEELVAVMTFGKPRFTDKYDYELVRFCSKLNTTIIGGASKLFAYFNNNYIGSIISYSDKRWSNGNLYKKLGFIYSHTSDPNYRYYRGNISLSRYQCQKHKLSDLLGEGFNPELSEYENMTEAGYIRMYDCGNDVWEFI